VRRPHRAAALVLAAVASAVGAAGCGVGSGQAPAGVSLSVTDDFGRRPVLRIPQAKVGGEETVMRLLARNARVETRYGGGFVQSIEGLAGGVHGGRPRDWFYYVNGVEEGRGAGAVRVHAGDRIWWDRHEWGGAMRIPAVVGAFPEPFRHGVDGKRLPVRVECAVAAAVACREVSRRLIAHGVPAARGGLGTTGAEETLRVLVGAWQALRRDPGARLLERGPAASGVYARPGAGGRTISVLDGRGRVTRVLRAGAGLVAATRFEDAQPTWFVSGTDARGVDAAARAFEEGALTERFALAISHDRGISLPDVRP
jgi:hypothetical protein